MLRSDLPKRRTVALRTSVWSTAAIPVIGVLIATDRFGEHGRPVVLVVSPSQGRRIGLFGGPCCDLLCGVARAPGATEQVVLPNEYLPAFRSYEVALRDRTVASAANCPRRREVRPWSGQLDQKRLKCTAAGLDLDWVSARRSGYGGRQLKCTPFPPDEVAGHAEPVPSLGHS